MNRTVSRRTSPCRPHHAARPTRNAAPSSSAPFSRGERELPSPDAPPTARSSRRWSSAFVAATSRPPGRSTRAISLEAVDRGRTTWYEHPGREHRSRTLASGTAAPARPPRARRPHDVRSSSTIRGDWSTATTSRELVTDPRGKLALAAAHLQHRAGARLGTPRPRARADRGPSTFAYSERASRQFCLGRVLPRDRRRIVDPHRSMIGRPGAPLPGCFAPSHAHTVAPTSPNSPSSWILPAAFFPAA